MIVPIVPIYIEKDQMMLRSKRTPEFW